MGCKGSRRKSWCRGSRGQGSRQQRYGPWRCLSGCVRGTVRPGGREAGETAGGGGRSRGNKVSRCTGCVVLWSAVQSGPTPLGENSRWYGL